MSNKKPIYVLMGVSGTGKTTIGKILSQELDIPFYDGDDFHPEANVEKMKNGKPLNDEDRAGWLKILTKKIEEWQDKDGAILACSALKEKYREQLDPANNNVVWIFLHADYKVIYKRLSERKNHYFKADMLQSQYKALEAPKYGIRVNVDATINHISKEILDKIYQQQEITA